MTRLAPGLGSMLPILLALVLSLWVVAANQTALFYFDTAGYAERGETLLAMVGLESEEAAPLTGGGEGSGEAEGGDDPGVDGTRSPAYSVILGLFAKTVGLEGLLLANAAFAVTALWLCVRVVLRVHDIPLRPASLTLLAVGAGALGSLSFFVALLMPDILAPVLILMAALLTGYAGRMTWGELLLATLFGCAAVLVHLSHQAIAFLLIPLALLGALLFARRRPLLAPALVALMALSGVAQQAAFRTAVQTVQKTDVVLLPYLTARLIQDGVGYEYLERNCPDPDIATCRLWEALQWSDDPYRLTATHIAFERSERLGSYRLMEAEDQRLVSGAQVEFFLDVLREDPVGVVFAFLKNTLIQARMNSVDMTLPTENVIERNASLDGFAFLEVEAGLLATDRDWLAPATVLQQALYATSVLVILIVALRPTTPGPFRAFLLMVLVGILVNAFVCGGVSQPATRYGSRVVWILPAIAAFALAVLRSGMLAPLRRGSPVEPR